MHSTKLSQIKSILDIQPLREKNPVVFVHSGLFPFGHLEDGVKGLCELLINWVGSNGTLIMPTFNFRQSDLWDHDKTPSEMGVLTEYFRKYPEVQRTIHPLHSVAVFGKYANYFTSEVESSSFGPKSPFAKLLELESINISLGTDFEGGATYLHYFEELASVHYREYVRINKKIIHSESKEIPEYFKYYARKKNSFIEWDNHWTHVLDDFLENGVIKIHKVGPAKIIYSDVNRVGKFFMDKLNENPNYCAICRNIIKK
jgi:aminoglycoside 3-N-acetyltransferase